MKDIKILVVDDEEHTRLGYAEVLEMENFKVSTAEDAFKAIELLKQDKFDIVVTDLRMPEMDGLAFLERLKQIDKNTKAIMITAFGSFKTYKKASDSGVVIYLNKPVRAAELMEAVHAVVAMND
ncbi:response regulator [Geovibrio thiophilus]|uniref:Response regulator n=1 Tax=Geovibrio thiophilus TaxID=139438 RepID=A0A410JUT8_9BACT|nr:response regulator [Geovibrio thiophilus]QAR31977.1 response regulator [Geovibrio thiophilus]